MANAGITKSAIASAMKQLMQTTPFDRITTADILDASHISRKTFYYHFRDKYDVVNWIFETEIVGNIMACTTLESWHEASYQMCRYFRENCAFYKNAVNARGQNCFIQFLHVMVVGQMERLCRAARDEGKLDDADFRFLVEFYYNAFIGVFIPWVRDDMREEPDSLVRRWIGVTDKSLEHYIQSRQRE